MKKLLSIFIITAVFLTGCVLREPTSETLSSGKNEINAVIKNPEPLQADDSSVAIIGDDYVYTPPRLAMLRSELELAVLREMALADDETLDEFLQNPTEYCSKNGIASSLFTIPNNSFYPCTIYFKTREELVSFLELLDNIPIPVLPNIKFGEISYYPDGSGIVIKYKTKSDEEYKFDYYWDEDEIERMLLGIKFESGERKLVWEDSEEQIKVYNTTNFNSIYGYIFIRFPMDVKDNFVMATYQNNNLKDIAEIVFSDVYENFACVDFKDIEWK